jgi:hypothetical protein
MAEVGPSSFRIIEEEQFQEEPDTRPAPCLVRYGSRSPCVTDHPNFSLCDHLAPGRISSSGTTGVFTPLRGHSLSRYLHNVNNLPPTMYSSAPRSGQPLPWSDSEHTQAPQSLRGVRMLRSSRLLCLRSMDMLQVHAFSELIPWDETWPASL